MEPTVEIDRYKTFKGIECEENCRRLLTILRLHIDDPVKSTPFWEKFRKKLDAAIDGGRRGDGLFLIHSYINGIRDFFEEQEDETALLLLERIELECC